MALATPARSAERTGKRTAESLRARLEGRAVDVRGALFRAALIGCLAVSVLILAVLLIDVVSGGWGTLTERGVDFLTSRTSTRAPRAGVAQGIRGTFLIGVIVAVLAFPVGVGAAIYLEEYAPPTRFTRFIDVNIRNLAGVPSVVYGILGLSIFVKALGGLTGPESNGRSVLSAGLILAVLVLPIVIITSAEALRAVPRSLREAGFGVGATRWEVVRHHVLPYAAPGILTGTVLALARALGEAAPLILVGAATGYMTGGDSYAPGDLRDRFTALPIQITEWSADFDPPFRHELAPAAIVVLLAVVLAANAAAILLRNRYEKKRG